MKRLGYTRYVSQGGDWGSVVADAMARQAPAGLLGIHVNMPATVPPEIAKALQAGESAAGRIVPRGKGRVRADGCPVQEGLRLCRHDGDAPADPGLQPGGFAGRPRGVVLRQVRRLDVQRRRARAGAHARRDARRHHALLAHEHRDLVARGSTGRTTPTTSMRWTSRSRRPSRSFPARFIKRRAAGPSAATTSSSTSTRSTRAATSRRGNSRSSSRPSSARRSSRCANRSQQPNCESGSMDIRMQTSFYAES